MFCDCLISSWLVLYCFLFVLFCLIMCQCPYPLTLTPQSTSKGLWVHYTTQHTHNTAHTRYVLVLSCFVVCCLISLFVVSFLVLPYLASKRVQTHNRIKLRVRIKLSLGLMYTHVHPCTHFALRLHRITKTPSLFLSRDLCACLPLYKYNLKLTGYWIFEIPNLQGFMLYVLASRIT
jgi:hypothetical protein